MLPNNWHSFSSSKAIIHQLHTFLKVNIRTVAVPAATTVAAAATAAAAVVVPALPESQ